MTDPARLDQLISTYARITATISEYNEQLDQVKAELRQLGTGTHHGSNGTATITAQRRFDPQLAADTLPAELAAACTETSINAAKARKILPPALYEACSPETGQPRVTVR